MYFHFAHILQLFSPKYWQNNKFTITRFYFSSVKEPPLSNLF